MEYSPLSRLPGELRNKIYELVLLEPSTINVSIKDDEPKKVRAENRPLSCSRLAIHGLPATCKALRSETQHLYFAINTFQFSTNHLTTPGEPWFWAKLLQQWIKDVVHGPVLPTKDAAIDLGTWKCKAGATPPTLDIAQLRLLASMFRGPVYMDIGVGNSSIMMKPRRLPIDQPQVAIARIRAQVKVQVNTMVKFIPRNAYVPRNTAVQAFMRNHEMFEAMLIGMIEGQSHSVLP